MINKETDPGGRRHAAVRHRGPVHTDGCGIRDGPGQPAAAGEAGPRKPIIIIMMIMIMIISMSILMIMIISNNTTNNIIDTSNDNRTYDNDNDTEKQAPRKPPLDR